MAVADRFSAASANLPLAGLSAEARRELEAVLARTAAFEDLPGKWQAALLESEAGGSAGAASSCCCSGRGAAAEAPAVAA